MFAGAVSYDKSPTAAALAKQVAESSIGFVGQTCRPLLHSETVHLYAIEREGGRSGALGWEDKFAKYWLAGDCVDCMENGVLDGVVSLEALSRQDIPGRWLAVRFDRRSGGLQLATDPLGVAWLYIGRVRNGWVFSPDFSAVARAVEHLTVDGEAAQWELAMGCSPMDRTLFEQICLAPAGAVFQLDSLRLSLLVRSALKYGDHYAGWAAAKKHQHLDGVFDRIFDRLIKPAQSELILSISAGFDSRYALALLEKHRVHPPLCTFGHPESEEVRGARTVCAKVGRAQHLFPVGESRWEQWQRCTRALGSSGMTQWVGWAQNWLEFVRHRGSRSLIGYLGDALSGKHHGRSDEGRRGWIDHWLNFHDVPAWAASPLLRREVRDQLPGSLRATLQEALSGRTFAFPHQQILELDLYGRQRRFVATQPNLIQRRLTPVLLFYDRALIDFWCNLAPRDLLGQRLYTEYAQSRFPSLFPAGEGDRPSVFARAARRALRAARTVLTGHEPATLPPVIDHRQIIVPNRAHILALARRTRVLAEPILDVDAFCAEIRSYGQGISGGSGVSSRMLLRTVNLLILLELANPE